MLLPLLQNNLLSGGSTPKNLDLGADSAVGLVDSIITMSEDTVVFNPNVKLLLGSRVGVQTGVSVDLSSDVATQAALTLDLASDSAVAFDDQTLTLLSDVIVGTGWVNLDANCGVSDVDQSTQLLEDAVVLFHASRLLLNSTVVKTFDAALALSSDTAVTLGLVSGSSTLPVDAIVSLQDEGVDLGGTVAVGTFPALALSSDSAVQDSRKAPAQVQTAVAVSGTKQLITRLVVADPGVLSLTSKTVVATIGTTLSLGASVDVQPVLLLLADMGVSLANQSASLFSATGVALAVTKTLSTQTAVALADRAALLGPKTVVQAAATLNLGASVDVQTTDVVLALTTKTAVQVAASAALSPAVAVQRADALLLTTDTAVFSGVGVSLSLDATVGVTTPSSLTLSCDLAAATAKSANLTTAAGVATTVNKLLLSSLLVQAQNAAATLTSKTAVQRTSLSLSLGTDASVSKSNVKSLGATVEVSALDVKLSLGASVAIRPRTHGGPRAAASGAVKEV